jgi:hypothetical protein
MGQEAVAVKETTAEQEANTAATQAGKQASDAYAQALNAVAGGQQDTSAKTEELTGKLKGLKAEFANQAQAVRESIEAYDGLIAKSGVTAAQVVKDLRNQVTNFKTYSRDVQRLIRAGVDPKAIQELSQKGPQYVHALATGTNKQLQTYKGYWQQRQAEVKGGFARSMQAQYEDLVRKIRDMQREINRLKGRTVAVGATAAISLQERTRRALLAMGIKGYGVKFLAKGGVTRLGQTAIVGEQGPELVRFSQPAQVYPADETRRILGRGMADGGIVGGFGQPSVAYARTIGRVAGETLAEVAGRKLSGVVNRWASGQLGGLSGPGGWQWQMAVLRSQFPGLPLISGYRPGAITSTGNRSYHGMGRAVDIPPRWDVFRWISATYGRNTRELIFTPAGAQQIKNGRHHVFTGGTIRQDHYNHIHWAYDRGGWLPPGLSLAYNGTGQPEQVLPPGRSGTAGITVHVDLRGSTLLGGATEIAAKLAPELRIRIRDAQRQAGIPIAHQLR